MIALWLALVMFGGAHAADLPAAPQRPGSVQGECLDAVELQPGIGRPCLSVSLPVSDVAWYLTVETDWQKIRDLYRIDVAACEFETESAEMRAEWANSQLELALQPVPILERPGTQVAFGVVAGVVVTMAAASALQKVEGGGND